MPPFYICADPEVCPHNIIVLVLSLIGLTCLGLVIWRIERKRRDRSRPETPIGRLVEQLVLTLCLVDLNFYVVGAILALDPYAVPDYVLGRKAYTGRVYHTHTALLATAFDAVGYLSLFWHATIARTMYSWIVNKTSASRLRNRWRLPTQVVIAVVLSLARILSYGTYTKAGRVVSGLLFRVIVFPTFLLGTLYWYLRTIQTLAGNFGSHTHTHGAPSNTTRTPFPRLHLLSSLMSACHSLRLLVPNVSSVRSFLTSTMAHGPTGAWTSVHKKLWPLKGFEEGFGRRWRRAGGDVEVGEDDEDDEDDADDDGGEEGIEEDGYHDSDDEYEEGCEEEEVVEEAAARGYKAKTEEVTCIASSAAELQEEGRAGISNSDATDTDAHTITITGGKRGRMKRGLVSKGAVEAPAEQVDAQHLIASDDFSRHAPVIRRLLCIVLPVAMIWVASEVFTIVAGPDSPLWVHWAAVIVNLLIGICDALVLGDLCSSCSRTSQSTNHHDVHTRNLESQAVVSSVVIPPPPSMRQLEVLSDTRAASRPRSHDGDTANIHPDNVHTIHHHQYHHQYHHHHQQHPHEGGLRKVGSWDHIYSPVKPQKPPLLGTHAHTPFHPLQPSSDRKGGMPPMHTHHFRRWPSIHHPTPATAPPRWGLVRSQSTDLTNRHQPSKPGYVRIFTTTWNAGGVSPTQLEAELDVSVWIPKGYDVYVIGVQECQCLKELKSMVHDYLGGPEAFAMYSRDLGASLNGVIGIVVAAAVHHVTDGAFSLHQGTVTSVAAGVSLGPMGKVANKGMVGMSARFFDCTLALVVVHFAADLRGRSRVARRHQDACTTLRELSLTWDTDRFDLHTQHHQTLLLGDLNYRVRAPPDEVLSLVATSATGEIAMIKAAARAKAEAEAKKRADEEFAKKKHEVAAAAAAAAERMKKKTHKRLSLAAAAAHKKLSHSGGGNHHHHVSGSGGGGGGEGRMLSGGRGGNSGGFNADGRPVGRFRRTMSSAAGGYGHTQAGAGDGHHSGGHGGGGGLAGGGGGSQSGIKGCGVDDVGFGSGSNSLDNSISSSSRAMHVGGPFRNRPFNALGRHYRSLSPTTPPLPPPTTTITPPTSTSHPPTTTLTTPTNPQAYRATDAPAHAHAQHTDTHSCRGAEDGGRVFERVYGSDSDLVAVKGGRAFPGESGSDGDGSGGEAKTEEGQQHGSLGAGGVSVGDSGGCGPESGAQAGIGGTTTEATANEEKREEQQQGCSDGRDKAKSWREPSTARFFDASTDPSPCPLRPPPPWPWVQCLDELSRAMANQKVLRGFKEGSIAFPPSYRWQRHGDGREFTDAGHLRAHAYTTNLKRNRSRSQLLNSAPHTTAITAVDTNSTPATNTEEKTCETGVTPADGTAAGIGAGGDVFGSGTGGAAAIALGGAEQTLSSTDGGGPLILRQHDSASVPVSVGSVRGAPGVTGTTHTSTTTITTLTVNSPTVITPTTSNTVDTGVSTSTPPPPPLPLPAPLAANPSISTQPPPPTFPTHPTTTTATATTLSTATDRTGGSSMLTTDSGSRFASSTNLSAMTNGVSGTESANHKRPLSKLDAATQRTLRTPSYTDRVLTHSLPGAKGKLTWVHYDMVDAVKLSDHRPVAAVLELQVDKAVRGFVDQTWSEVPPDAASSLLPTPSVDSTTHMPPRPPLAPGLHVPSLFTKISRKDDLRAFIIKLSRPVFDRRPSSHPHTQPHQQHPWSYTQSSQNGGEGEDDGVKEVVVLFPIPAEDPLAFQRKAQSLLEVIPGGPSMVTQVSSAYTPSSSLTDLLPYSSNTTTTAMPTHPTTSSSSSASNASLSSLSTPSAPLKSAAMVVPWSAFPVKHTTTASLRFSQHMLLKVVDSTGSSLGQGVIEVRLFAGAHSKRARVEVSSGGVLTGYLSVDVKVRFA